MQDVKFRLAVNGKLLRVDCGSKQDRVAETARLVIGIIEKNRLVERNIAVQRKGKLVKEKCDFLVSVPIKGKIDSLNASVAAAIIMFEKNRQDSVN